MYILIRDFALTVFIVLLALGIYDVDNETAYDALVTLIAENQGSFLGTGAIGIVFLLGFSAIFEQIGVYKITYGMSKAFARLSQLSISFLSILNVIFYATTGGNFLFQSGYINIIFLFIILGASCWTIRLNDFNYHSRNAMVPVGMLAVMSILLVSLIWPKMGF